MTKRFLPIGPAERIHLKQPEIHAKLDLLFAVLAFEPADDYLTRLVLPGIKQVRNIHIHLANTLAKHLGSVNEVSPKEKPKITVPKDSKRIPVISSA
jgi:hypothetical protein